MSNRKKLPNSAAVTATPPAPISRLNRRGRPFGPDNPGRPFPPGHTGRPKGARNKATMMLEAMFAGEAEEIGRKAIELAKDGTVGAVKLILDRAYPLRNGRTLEGLKLPPVTTAAEAVAAMGAITRGVSEGELTIAEARDLSVLLDTFRKMHELAEIERRIGAIEKRIVSGQGSPQAVNFSAPSRDAPETTGEP